MVSLSAKIKNIFIALFLGAILLPISLEEWMAVETSSWSMPILATVWQYIPVIGLVGVIFVLINKNL